MVRRRGYFRKPRTTELGKYLTELRKKHKFTLQQVADKIRRSKSCICRIEIGQRSQKSLRGGILYELAHAYGVPTKDIQRKAHWPQLTLPLDVTGEEMEELLRHLERIRGKKQQKRQDIK